MSVFRINAIALIVSTSMLSCFVKRNENYCEGRNPNNNCSEPDTRPDAAPPSCPDEIECSAPTGVCNTGTGQCVQCTAGATGNQAACTGNTPVCGADNTCQACSAHIQCKASNVCLPTGACAAENDPNVAYVGPGGSGTACSKAQPCSLEQAVNKGGRDYVKMTGHISDGLSITGNRAVSILADPQTRLTSSAAVVVKVDDTATVNIYDLIITSLNDGGIGISMQPGNSATLSLYRATVTNNKGGGIVASGGTLNIIQSTLSGNPGGGVTTSGGGTLNIMRSTIAENTGGGINMISATTFEIRNNFIVRNGALSAVAGGVRAIPAGNSKFEFNTVVSNNASSGAVNSAGLACVSPIPAPYNLVFNNSLSGVVNADDQIVVCDRDGSLRSEPQAGAGFTNTATNNYHLTANSPAEIRDLVSCSSTPKLVDIDGEDRPKNGKCDLGADEY